MSARPDSGTCPSLAQLRFLREYTPHITPGLGHCPAPLRLAALVSNRYTIPFAVLALTAFLSHSPLCCLLPTPAPFRGSTGLAAVCPHAQPGCPTRGDPTSCTRKAAPLTYRHAEGPALRGGGGGYCSHQHAAVVAHDLIRKLPHGLLHRHGHRRGERGHGQPCRGATATAAAARVREEHTLGTARCVCVCLLARG